MSTSVPLEWTRPGPVLLALAAGFAVALVATPLLAALAARAGLLDPRGRAGSEHDRARKLQERPVALVGGAVVLLALLVGVAAPAAPGLPGSPGSPGSLGVSSGGFALLGLAAPSGAALALALAAAFAAGLADDLAPRGLGASAKLVAQLAAGVPLGVGLAEANPGVAGAATFVLLAALGSALALNAVNTFDNADGAAASLGALALCLPAPAAAGALFGFLPFNLDGRRTAAGGRSAPAPTAYLGDSGSHLLGMLVLVSPAAWPALALPLLDLARVAVERAVEGDAPWRGDRRHLAHRLAGRGLSRAATLAVLTAVAAPALVLGFAGLRAGAAGLLLGGAGGTALLYALALVFARRRARPLSAGRILRRRPAGVGRANPGDEGSR